MAIDDRDNLQVITEQLNKLGGYQSDASGTRMVCCPFHADGSPSCGIVLDVQSKVPLGFFNCLGCGEKGPWNKFAEKTGLEKIKAWNSKVATADQLVTSELEEHLLGEEGFSLKSIFKKMGCPEAQPWPEAVDWRGFPGKLVAAVSGHIISDNFTDSIAVLFPVVMSGRIRGAVKAVYEKREGQRSSYITMKGNWILRYGLFPYAFTKKIVRVRNYDFVILVEGPRDALRLLANGIPALAILGAHNMSDTKSMFINSLGVSTVYVMSDADEGGDKMWANCKKFLSGHVTVKRFKLPTYKIKELQDDGTVKRSKIDPGNMPAKVLRRLVDFLKSEHGLREPKNFK